ncbi:MAG: dTMP kinase [Candidatus Omnitrophota bacterium]
MKRLKGKFITFEGSEGSGKSTQARLLAQYLKSRGHKTIFLREPGGTRLSEKIRRILLDKSNQEISPVSEMLLYMAARAQLIQEVIKPAKDKGEIVICDRFLDSTIAYQGWGLGVDLSLIGYLGNYLTAEVKPDMTLFLDVGVRKGLRACGRVLDRIEQRPIVYHQRVRQGYLKLAAKYPQRIKIIRPNKDKLITQAKIRGVVEKYLLKVEGSKQGVECRD